MNQTSSSYRVPHFKKLTTFVVFDQNYSERVSVAELNESKLKLIAKVEESHFSK